MSRKKSPHITLILARARNGVIGCEGKIPWHIPADLRRFKHLTMGTVMIMGRKTFESFPAPLPSRRHIVLTRDPHWAAAGAEVVHSVAAALALADVPHISIIGGAEIYALFLPSAQRIDLTEVHLEAAGDTFMPPFEPAWQEQVREHHAAEGEHPAYDFVTLVRA